ncbi:ribbon-helix-helix protein, CopG family [Roseivivax isoporae]|uniref:ribbon-helix-helix protein, CopG family n=1 Tax=Roseivivax isoporae TaxID=591206 RepID=UPI0031380418
MKSRGRPKADTSPVMVRIDADMLAAIDDVRRTEEDVPTRPEMIRRMISDWLETREGTSSDG